MTAMTYTTLVSDIQNYAERDDSPFLDQIPRFIMLAENRIASEVRGLGLLKAVTFQTAIGDPVIEKPARWRETVSISLTRATVGTHHLFPRQYQYLKTYWPVTASTGVPEFYSDYDYEHLFVAPTPAAVYDCEWLYHERPEELSASNETNWTTQYAPQIILYASLLEAQPFLKRAERIQEFQALYERAIMALGRENTSRISDNSMQVT